MGEHAAVYGRPALVAASGPRVRAEARLRDGTVVIELADFRERAKTTWSEITGQASKARDAWQRYSQEPTPERFAAIRSDSPVDLVIVALGETVRELAVVPPPINLRVESGLPVGSGFGSSAATAVAVVGGVLALLEGSLDVDRIDRLALEIERRQHGLPSGVDHKTVLQGGVVWAERSTEGRLEIVPLAVRSPILSRLQVFHTGRPVENTGEVVAAVKRRGERWGAGFGTLLDRMRQDVEELRVQLLAPQPDSSMLRELIQDYESRLEELGVVPAPVQESIRQIEAMGGSAKISGAGALTGAAAGCLLVYWPDETPAKLPAGLAAYGRPEVELGAEGVRLEELV